ncbi:hypothetical protein BJP27_24560 (plasmid) [Pseudomonas oryzihabitans]|nr:hypothetical protein BJP27_23910 [Pseudomonas psychrotolerans]APQ14744.1 hypothetical protein BJP27_24560 [Pseudomonas psychrotolerans]
MSKSLKKLLQCTAVVDGPNGPLIPLRELHLPDGWATSRHNNDLVESFQEIAQRLILDESQRLLRDINELMPPIEVVPRKEGGVWVCEGELIVRAYRLLTNLGYKLPLIRIKPYEGTDVQRKAPHSATIPSLDVTPLDKARLLLEQAERESLTIEDLVQRTGMKRQQVDQLLRLARSPLALQNLVEKGAVAAGTAIKALFYFKDETPRVIAAIHRRTGKKVLPKDILRERERAAAAAPALEDESSDDLMVSAKRLAEELTPEERELMQRFSAGEDMLGDMPVQLTVRQLFALVSGASKADDKKPKGKARKRKEVK